MQRDPRSTVINIAGVGRQAASSSRGGRFASPTLDARSSPGHKQPVPGPHRAVLQRRLPDATGGLQESQGEGQRRHRQHLFRPVRRRREAPRVG